MARRTQAAYKPHLSCEAPATIEPLTEGEGSNLQTMSITAVTSKVGEAKGGLDHDLSILKTHSLGILMICLEKGVFSGCCEPS